MQSIKSFQINYEIMNFKIPILGFNRQSNSV